MMGRMNRKCLWFARSSCAFLLATVMAAGPVFAKSTQNTPFLALAGSMEAMPKVPEYRQVRVKKSNYRRAMWGYGLTITGILGVLVGAAGMILYSSSADRDQGPSALADPRVARRYRRQQRAGLAMLFSGLSVGVGGLVSGPLLIRSARRRQAEAWSQEASLSFDFSQFRLGAQGSRYLR